MKKRICIGMLVLVSILLSNLGNTFVRAEIGGEKGFIFDTSKYYVKFYEYQSFKVKTEGGGAIGQLSYLTGLARRKDTNTYVFMMKECMTPSENRVRVRKVEDTNENDPKPYTGWGVSEYMIVETYLKNLDEWAPRNEPKTKKITISVGGAKGADPGVGASVGVSYDINLKDIEIKPQAYQPNGHYTVNYNYMPHEWFWTDDNSYFADSSIHYQEAEFSTNEKNITLNVNYLARFGLSTTESRFPWTIFSQYVWNQVGSRSYSYTLPRHSYTPSSDALNFLDRLYRKFLNRAPDTSGKNYWALDLTNEDVTAASLVFRFYQSDEFRNKKVSDEELVRRLYLTCLDRKPDDAGMLYWVKQIKTGQKTRDQVVKDFIYSEEFTNLCKKYHFNRGTI